MDQMILFDMVCAVFTRKHRQDWLKMPTAWLATHTKAITVSQLIAITFRLSFPALAKLAILEFGQGTGSIDWNGMECPLKTKLAKKLAR